MAITLDGSTGVTAPALTGSIDASNLTGSLPAIDGSALIGIASGGMTLLGSVATTSGQTVTLSGLDLTNYKLLLLVGKAISLSATQTYPNIAIGGVVASGSWPINRAISGLTSSADYVVSFLTWVDILHDVYGSSGSSTSVTASGGMAGTTNTSGNTGHGITTSSTSVSISSPDNFDAGTLYVYGVA